jgi:monoterpene epsilon-lactone hydrolase
MTRVWMGAACFAVLAGTALAGAAMAQARTAPARPLPTPTDVSPQLQAMIARPIAPTFNVIPKTIDEWTARQKASAETGAQGVTALAARLHVKVEPGTLGGVPVFIVTPQTVAPENRNRLLIHIHGGCYVLGGGLAAANEAVMMAGLGHYKVISVDYRMPPAAYFPAALDDVITVWKEALKTRPAKAMAVFGSSAGGALTLETVLRAKQLGLPLPAAIAPGTPMADLTGVGDSFQTNAMVDNVLVSPEGFCGPAAEFYAHGHDLKDPLLSPVYGDMRGLPPAILTTGTRDLLLSTTVRVHRKLKDSGVEADLNVFEAQSHAQYARDETAPETLQAFGDIAKFFDRHLAK